MKSRKIKVVLNEQIEIVFLEVLKSISRKISGEKCTEMSLKTSSAKNTWFCINDRWIMTRMLHAGSYVMRFYNIAHIWMKTIISVIEGMPSMSVS